MATYAWTIDKLYTKDITKSGKTYKDAILRVEATLTGTSETIGSISGQSIFDLDMNVDNIDSSFTAYNSVTEANVKTWVENRVDSSILANIKAEIEAGIDFEEKVHGSTPKGTTNSDGDFTASFPWD
jgi:hypothetical protein|tara:strand:+ start:1671 stop:2051 length:381 start_codon:yes stop_codon:yes gene_type:complete